MIAATSAFSTALAAFLRGPILLMITIQGYSRVFTNYKSGITGQYDWIVSTQDISTTIHDLEGGADQVQFAFNVLDKGAGVTADFPGFTFEGKLITVQVGMPGLSQVNFVTLFTGYVDTVASDNNNLEYTFNCSDISSRLTQVIYLNGDNGLPIASGNPRTLLAHPLDLLINILSNQIGMNLIPDFDNEGGQWIADASIPYLATGGQISGGSWVYTGTGAAGGFHFPRSPIITVVPGQTYTLSAYIDASHVTSIAGGGLPTCDIYDPTITTFYAGIGQAIGASGQVSTNWTVPAGVTQVRFIFDTGNCTVAIGQPLVFSDAKVSIFGAPNYMDVNKIRAYRDGPFSGASFKFELTQSVAAIDFIKQQILKPLGGYLWVNSLGVLTVNFFYPLASPAAVATLGPNSWTSIPTAEQVGSSATEMINQVQFQFDKDDATPSSSGNYLAVDTEIYSASVNKYAQYGEQVIQSDGLRSGFQGFFTARLVARMIFGRYGLKSLVFDQNAADSIWQTCLLEPGDIVAVTHPQIPDRAAGVMGIAGKLFEIINKKVNLTEGLLTYTMIDGSYLQTFGLFKIVPNGQADYNLLANPSAFDTASWTKDGGSTVTANNVADPDGVLTGDTLTQGAGPFSDFATIYQKLAGNATAAGWEFTIELKVAAGTAVVQILVGDYSLHAANKSVTVTTQWQPFTVALNPALMSNTGFIAGGVITQNTQVAGFQLQMCRAGLFNPALNISYMYLCDNTDKYTNNDPAHTLG